MKEDRFLVNGIFLFVRYPEDWNVWVNDGYLSKLMGGIAGKRLAIEFIVLKRALVSTKPPVEVIGVSHSRDCWNSNIFVDGKKLNQSVSAYVPSNSVIELLDVGKKLEIRITRPIS